MTEQLTYVYAVLPDTAPEPSGLVGLLGGAVRLVRGRSLALAVSDAPAEVVALDSTSDPQVAADVALTHFEVVGALFRTGPLLPMRMCTMFASDDSALQAVNEAAPGLLDALASVDGAAQWTVKVPLRAAQDDIAAVSTSGSDYLRRLGDRRRDETKRLAEARDDAARLLEDLARHAVDVEPGADDGRTLSASFLVNADAAEAFARCARDGARGRDVEVLGPLPPYSFVPRLEHAS